MIASRAFGGTLIRWVSVCQSNVPPPRAHAGLADGRPVLVVESDDDAGQLLRVLAGADVLAANLRRKLQLRHLPPVDGETLQGVAVAARHRRC